MMGKVAVFMSGRFSPKETTGTAMMENTGVERALEGDYGGPLSGGIKEQQSDLATSVRCS